MAKCIRCKVNIDDDALICPLCRGVLVQDEERYAADTEKGEDISEAVRDEEGAYISKSMTYPDIAPTLKRMQLAIKIALFAAVLVEIAALIINYLTFNKVWWSLIVGIVLCYGCFTLIYSFSTRKSLQRIIQVQAFAAIILMVALDYVIGYQGWAVKYAIPITLMSISVGVVVLMIINVESWQNYIMTEITSCAVSVILLILDIFNVIHSSILLVIAAGVTSLILAGTVLFGTRLVSDEIKRRFRV